MVIDTSDAEYIAREDIFFNVVAHEFGHALALNHVTPIDQTKLMEASILSQLRGPQFDDRLQLHAVYGDALEHISGTEPPQNLSGSGPWLIERASIHADDIDRYHIFLPEPAELLVRIEPLGSTYPLVQSGSRADFRADQQRDFGASGQPGSRRMGARHGWAGSK